MNIRKLIMVWLAAFTLISCASAVINVPTETTVSTFTPTITFTPHITAIQAPTETIVPNTPIPEESPKEYVEMTGLSGETIQIAVLPKVAVPLKKGYSTTVDGKKVFGSVELLTLATPQDAFLYMTKVKGILDMTLEQKQEFAIKYPELFRETVRGTVEIAFSRSIPNNNYEIKGSDGNIFMTSITLDIFYDEANNAYLFAGPIGNDPKKDRFHQKAYPFLIGTSGSSPQEVMQKLLILLKE